VQLDAVRPERVRGTELPDVGIDEDRDLRVNLGELQRRTGCSTAR